MHGGRAVYNGRLMGVISNYHDPEETICASARKSVTSSEQLVLPRCDQFLAADGLVVGRQLDQRFVLEAIRREEFVADQGRFAEQSQWRDRLSALRAERARVPSGRGRFPILRKRRRIIGYAWTPSGGESRANLSA